MEETCDKCGYGFSDCICGKADAKPFSDEELKQMQTDSAGSWAKWGDSKWHNYLRFLATITADRKRIEQLERERDNYLEQARLYSKNSDYYSGLLDKIAENFGKDAFISDDSSIQDSPLRAKMPQLVADQTATIEWLRGVLEKIAVYGDRLANEHLLYFKSYGAFDEPSSVQIARQALDAGKE